MHDDTGKVRKMRSRMLILGNPLGTKSKAANGVVGQSSFFHFGAKNFPLIVFIEYIIRR
jgi:hypothetical protein